MHAPAVQCTCPYRTLVAYLLQVFFWLAQQYWAWIACPFALCTLLIRALGVLVDLWLSTKSKVNF